jgi:hypothetical protein
VSAVDALERRYRRLLHAYPAAYRRQREDELVVVLLDGAAEGQRRPTAAEALDLVRGGLATRWHTGTLTAPTGTWADAIAVATVLLVGMFTLRAVHQLGDLAYDAVADMGYDGADWWRYQLVGAGPSVLPPITWVVAAVLLVTARRRRWAGAVALAGAALEARAVFGVAGIPVLQLPATVPWLVVHLLVALLLLRPGLGEHGIGLVGAPTWLLAVVSATVATFLIPFPPAALDADPSRSAAALPDELLLVMTLGPLLHRARRSVGNRRLVGAVAAVFAAAASLRYVGVAVDGLLSGTAWVLPVRLAAESAVCVGAAVLVLAVSVAAPGVVQRMARRLRPPAA